MSSKFTTVRLSVAGEHFEILVNPENALNHKLGRKVEISQVLGVEEIYSDSNKGLRVSAEKLQKAFKTIDITKVAEIILRDGELQLTTAQRHKMVEDKKKQIINMISKSFVDPRTMLPHPPLRIEQALQDAKVVIDPFRDANEQAKKVIDAIRIILPLKSEKQKFKIVVPPQFAPQSIGALKSFGDIQKEEWGADGSLTAIIEIPAGVRTALIERLGSVSKGAAQVVEVK